MSSRRSPEYRQYIEDRGLSSKRASFLGLRYSDAPRTKARIGVAKPAVRIPYFDTDGNVIHERFRILQQDPALPKFMQASGTANHIYIPADKHCRLARRKVRRTIHITEGELKAAALSAHGHACIGISGAHSWQKDGIPLADWDLFKWKGRTVEIHPDFDFWRNPNVARGFIGLGQMLEARGATVLFRIPSDAAGTGKTGVDDYLQRRSIEDFLAEPAYALDTEVIRKRSEQVGTATNEPAFELEPIASAWLNEPPPPLEYLVHGLFPRNTVALLGAEGGLGKTFVGIALSMAVASGRKFMGLSVRQGPVVYVALEDPPSILRTRIHRIYKQTVDGLSKQERAKVAQAIQKNLMAPSLAGQQFHIVNVAKNVAAQTAALGEFIERVRAIKPELIVLDPMSRLHGADENANAMGTALINAAERIAKETGAAVLVMHHVGKINKQHKNESAYGLRGASGIADAARVVLMMRAIDDAERAKIKNAPPGDVLKLVHAKCNYAPRYPDIWLHRTTDGALSRFDPEFTTGDDSIETFVQRLRQIPQPFTARSLRDHGFSRTKTNDLLAKAVEAGLIAVSEIKARGGTHYELREKADA